MSRPYSHPPEDGQKGTYLLDHLVDVASRVEYVVPEDAETPSGESLRSIIETLGYVHDFGKATTYFQQYLETGRSPDEDRRLRYHAPLGSFAAYYSLKAQGFDAETCLAGFVAVAKHHGQLPNVAQYVFDKAHGTDGRDEEHAILAKQIKDIDAEAAGLARDTFEEATNGMGSWGAFRDEFVDLLEDIETHVATRGIVPEPREDALSGDFYGFVLQCWGSLVLADKTSAAGAPNDDGTFAATEPSTSHLDEYVQQLEADVRQDEDGTRDERLNHYRSRARRAVLDSISEFEDRDSDVATLTLPTGMGKTLTGLSAALRLRDDAGKERVVYALPFTSIIDQVVEELETIYDTDGTGRLLTAHHHLAETTVRDAVDDEQADLSDDVAGMLAESWLAGLTVTTFVQLFESLAGPRNRQSMKLPALRNAVVLLDEPQSLPLDWWKLVPRLVEVLTEQYDATVIAMTATQPRLFDDEFELVDDPDAYFDDVRRVSYELDDSTERYIESQSEPKSYAEAASQLREAVESGETTLAVCNTIDSARTLTEQVDKQGFVDVGGLFEEELQRQGSVGDVDPVVLAERVESRDRVALLHLSTRLRPADRLRLIETVKELTARDQPTVAVSTQLVEAGVDISFDRVYRDLAPIDSIVQAAGRCNRSFERDRGIVTVWWLDAPAEQSKTPAEAVYNRSTTLLPTVADTLQQVRDESGSLTEKDVARTAVERYFERLREDKDVGKQEWANWVDDSMGKELGDISLIDQRRSAEVVVARTDEERKVFEQIHEAQERYDYAALDDLVEETKPLRISVPYYREDSDRAEAIRDLTVLIEDQGVYQLDASRESAKFDATTGFVAEASSVDHQFL
ncbi:CRISPR-associated helicase Cas3 family protein [Halorhabdus tiamatea SARL4B]|uniref:CRISPR-associated helicase Cas3 family protein n=1 Tax=Halorhabdus tiamatea SARL4B TaxID=1033806 RepID=S6D8M3_9EURY|nr:CRISPR-associated endonuclease Cas3'' [Halorhabdus tiamatea]ERJ06793.1 CRISPR-associated helicase Cas3 family protein [Halorhabdus tiamatea SARL4B]CCQ33716.1 CRISPR-associated helicase, Cas3 [Halorhabdus tiamatea SARL4B]